MGEKTAGQLLEEAQRGYSALPVMMKTGAAGVILPLIGAVELLLRRIERLEGGANG